MLLEQLGVVLDEGLDELGEQQDCLAVAGAHSLHLLKQPCVLVLLHTKVLLCSSELLLNGLDPLLQIVHEVLLFQFQLNWLFLPLRLA